MDYIIQHGTVIDGTGAARFAADVLLRDGKIAEVAPYVPPVGQVINARGMIVCPGFIDMHTHSQLLSQPYCGETRRNFRYPYAERS